MIDKTTTQRETVVVIGNGMVGHRFCELLAERDVDRRSRIVTFCEEPARRVRSRPPFQLFRASRRGTPHARQDLLV